MSGRNALRVPTQAIRIRKAWPVLASALNYQLGILIGVDEVELLLWLVQVLKVIALRRVSKE